MPMNTRTQTQKIKPKNTDSELKTINPNAYAHKKTNSENQTLEHEFKIKPIESTSFPT